MWRRPVPSVSLLSVAKPFRRQLPRAALRGGRISRDLGVIVHCDDGEYGYAYDRKSHVGRLARVLSEAP